MASLASVRVLTLIASDGNACPRRSGHTPGSSNVELWSILRAPCGRHVCPLGRELRARYRRPPFVRYAAKKEPVHSLLEGSLFSAATRSPSRSQRAPQRARCKAALRVQTLASAARACLRL